MGRHAQRRVARHGEGQRGTAVAVVGPGREAVQVGRGPRRVRPWRGGVLAGQGMSLWGYHGNEAIR